MISQRCSKRARQPQDYRIKVREFTVSKPLPGLPGWCLQDWSLPVLTGHSEENLIMSDTSGS